MTGMSATCGVCRTVIVRWFEDKSPEWELHDSYLIAISRGLGKVNHLSTSFRAGSDRPSGRKMVQNN